MFQTAIIVLTGIGGPVFVLVVELNLLQAIRFVRRARQAEGFVSEIVELAQRPIGGGLYQARIKFRTQDGQDVEFDNRNLTSKVYEVVGQKVTVLYDPAKPPEAMIQTAWLWINPAVALLTGLFFAAICVANLAQFGQ